MFVPSACLFLLPHPLPPLLRAPLITAPPSRPAPRPSMPPSIASFPVKNLVSVCDCFVFVLEVPDEPTLDDPDDPLLDDPDDPVLDDPPNCSCPLQVDKKVTRSVAVFIVEV